MTQTEVDTVKLIREALVMLDCSHQIHDIVGLCLHWTTIHAANQKAGWKDETLESVNGLSTLDKAIWGVGKDWGRGIKGRQELHKDG